jgi:hypothetical protein
MAKQEQGGTEKRHQGTYSGGKMAKDSKVTSGRVSGGSIRSKLIDRALDRLPRANQESRGKW